MLKSNLTKLKIQQIKNKRILCGQLIFVIQTFANKALTNYDFKFIFNNCVDASTCPAYKFGLYLLFNKPFKTFGKKIFNPV